MSDLLLANIIGSKLIEEAEKTLGITEHGGENCGAEVEEFQRTVDGRAQGEAWCMSWLQTIVERVSSRFDAPNPLPKSELCRAVWHGTPLKYRAESPSFGMGVIWKRHCGLVTRRDSGSPVFHTIEGNTNTRGEREGDGVYRKIRQIKGGTGSFELLGFVDLPAMIRDGIRPRSVEDLI